MEVLSLGLLYDLFESLTLNDIVIPRAVPVFRYMVRHSDLFGVLGNILHVTREAVGKDVQLSLELYSDPEIDVQYLTLYVRSLSYDEDFWLKVLDARNKCVDKLTGIRGRLLITTDFEDPTPINTN